LFTTKEQLPGFPSLSPRHQLMHQGFSILWCKGILSLSFALEYLLNLFVADFISRAY